MWQEFQAAFSSNFAKKEVIHLTIPDSSFTLFSNSLIKSSFQLLKLTNYGRFSLQCQLTHLLICKHAPCLPTEQFISTLKHFHRLMRPNEIFVPKLKYYIYDAKLSFHLLVLTGTLRALTTSFWCPMFILAFDHDGTVYFLFIIVKKVSYCLFRYSERVHFYQKGVFFKLLLLLYKQLYAQSAKIGMWAQTLRAGSIIISWWLALYIRVADDNAFPDKFISSIQLKPQQCSSIKPGFHMIVRIVSDARIAKICEQRSLRWLGNCLVSVC